MLEKARKSIDIRPTHYPFHGNPSACHQSPEHRSVTQKDYAMRYRPRSRAELPEIIRKDTGSGNTPHGRNAFHIYKMDKTIVCSVKSSGRLSDDLDLGKPRTLSTETHSSFTPKVNPYSKVTVSREEAIGIVPATCLQPGQNEERMLPVTRRDKIVHMTSHPANKYCIQKRKTERRQHDTRVEGEGTRLSNDISNLTGRTSTRKRFLNGPIDTLPVKGFDGGAVLRTNRDNGAIRFSAVYGDF